MLTQRPGLVDGCSIRLELSMQSEEQDSGVQERL